LYICNVPVLPEKTLEIYGDATFGKISILSTKKRADPRVHGND
jgi:hypothetical protein